MAPTSAIPIPWRITRSRWKTPEPRPRAKSGSWRPCRSAGSWSSTPPEARYDKTTSKLYWTIDQIDPGSKAMTFPFQVRMGGIGRYEVLADAIGEGALKAQERKVTDVIGIADVDLVVSESKRVVDVGGTDHLPDPAAELWHQGRDPSPGHGQPLQEPQI